ncbi:uncharacterized protein A4U43_C03F19240 [Asparagus officinalis]|uniref:Uncharacterized protein n=1 Tax=Asparagus officinalis TaxID=4686 RepID=A0A5P1FD58_ASPOF|nr:uncharacterized TPR repeat-containing protein At1g05150-like [Asparagus officinalis]ONK75663.1 uncharacterized protein A4U43_C03F19240 [Asparagus officinalis]
MARAEKVRRIFERFDVNARRDGGVSRRVTLASVQQISAILDEVFRTYSEFIVPNGVGLSLDGLLRTYDDGAGDVDRDFDALSLPPPSPPPQDPDLNPKITDLSLPSSSNSAKIPASAAQPTGVAYDATWQLLDDLEILIKRLHKSAEKTSSSNNNNNSDSFSETGWSREMGPTDRQITWDESSPDYAVFAKEVAGLRARADSSRAKDEAFDGQMAIGKALYDHQLFSEALKSFQRACELQPTDVRPHFRAGNTLYALGKHSDAKEEFLLALEAGEASGNQWAQLLPQIHVNLGIAMEAEGMVLSACEHYREAAILCPSHFRALKLLGSALFGVGEYRAAEKALEEAVFLKPDYADAHCDLGSALHAMGDDERAIQEFQKAIDLKPGHVDALYNLGGLYMDMGRFARASEMYTRVLSVRPNNWRAQLNKAVALLGAGEAEDAKKALKDAFKMTKRVEVYDAIAHLKMLQKKKNKGKGNDGDGESGFLVVEASKFKRVGRKTTLRQDLANALEIRAFQKLTRLSRCDVEVLKKEMNETDVPVSYSGSGVPEKSIRKAALEVILRKILNFLKAETFLGAVKAINERVLSVLDSSGSGRVDLGMFFAVLAPICSGPTDKRKRVVFDALLWRPNNENGSQIWRSDAVAYIKFLRAVYIPSHGVSDMMELHGESDQSLISYTEFLEMFNDRDWGFGILNTLVKLENGDRMRHGGRSCSICRYPIIGSRFKETKHHFSLCNRCYSEGKVPSTFKQEEYRFKEYGSEAEAMKDKCLCFNLQSNALNGDP